MPEIYSINILIIIEVFNILYNNSSDQINNKYRHHDRHSLRKNTNNFIRVPEKHERRKCTGFTYCGAKIFNNLPNNIRETQDSIIFKNLVKNWIWDEIPSYWLQQNIYLITFMSIYLLQISISLPSKSLTKPW